MALEDIKSPLPPRRFSSLYEESPTTDTDVKTEEKVEGPKIEQPITVSKSMPVAKPLNLGKFLPILGILVLIGVIVFLVFKVIIPNLGGNKGGDVTLNYWGLWEEPATIQGIIADFESKNPGVKINYVRNQKVNYRTRLKTRLDGETTDEVPDIFRYHSSWIPMFKSNLAKVPTDVAGSIGLDGDFFDAYKKTIKINGSWQGVPLMYDGLSLFYNKDLIESAGVSLPKSWWDLEQSATN